MIRDSMEYEVTKRRLEEFKDSLSKIESDYVGTDENKRLLVVSIDSQVKIFEQEILEYERLISGKYTFIKHYTKEELRKELTRKRIADEWSVQELAMKLNLSQIQLQSYEECDYVDVEDELLLNAAEILGLSVLSSEKSKFKETFLRFMKNCSEFFRYALSHSKSKTPPAIDTD